MKPSTRRGMRIDVHVDASHLSQLRAYAEYRVFTRLASVADHVRTVRVVVSPAAAHRMTSCVMSAELDHAVRIQARSRDSQPIRAIDIATQRLGEAISKQV